MAVLMLVRKPMMPHKAMIQKPKSNLFCSQKPRYKNIHRGNRTEKPNWVTQMIRDRIFIDTPQLETTIIDKLIP